MCIRDRARVGHTHLAAHLTDDDFDMLIVDVNALQTVDLLDFTDQVVLGGDGTLDGQNILGISVAFGQQSTLGDDVALQDVYKRQGSSSRW